MIRIEAWPRADGLIEIEGDGLMWRGKPAEAEIYLAGLRAGLDLGLRTASKAAAWEIEDRRPIRLAPPPRPGS